MEKGLVSVMIPCYNGEKFLHRLFKSLLAQTYKRQQIIFVNDGSVDKTEKIVLKYKELFEEQGITFLYLYQENSGQAAAINNALCYIEGEYCMWFDADDFMTIDHIERKVKFLFEHPEFDLVMCKGYIVKDHDINRVIGKLGYEKAVGTLLEDIIFEYRRCTPGLYMVRSKELIESLENRKIYESEAGQNIQLLLPIIKKGKNGFLDEDLFFYVLREDSHSRALSGSDNYIKRFDDLEEVKLHVVNKLKLENRYKKQLLYHIRVCMLTQKIHQLGINISYENTVYINKLISDFLNLSDISRFLGDRKLFLWGVCKISEQIRKLFDDFLDIHIKGYVDSDKNKVGLKIDNIEIYDTEVIDSKKIYLIIPLERHDDILKKLQDKEYVLRKDFFYPKLELGRFLAGENY